MTTNRKAFWLGHTKAVVNGAGGNPHAAVNAAAATTTSGSIRSPAEIIQTNCNHPDDGASAEVAGLDHAQTTET